MLDSFSKSESFSTLYYFQNTKKHSRLTHESNSKRLTMTIKCFHGDFCEIL